MLCLGLQEHQPLHNFLQQLVLHYPMLLGNWMVCICVSNRKWNENNEEEYAKSNKILYWRKKIEWKAKMKWILVYLDDAYVQSGSCPQKKSVWRRWSPMPSFRAPWLYTHSGSLVSTHVSKSFFNHSGSGNGKSGNALFRSTKYHGART